MDTTASIMQMEQGRAVARPRNAGRGPGALRNFEISRTWPYDTTSRFEYRLAAEHSAFGDRAVQLARSGVAEKSSRYFVPRPQEPRDLVLRDWALRLEARGRAGWGVRGLLKGSGARTPRGVRQAHVPVGVTWLASRALSAPGAALSGLGD